jgi:hypothetical protein
MKLCENTWVRQVARNLGKWLGDWCIDLAPRRKRGPRWSLRSIARLLVPESRRVLV